MRLSISGSGEYLIGSKNSIKAELCSYCFRHSSSGDCFSCRQCKRRVHRDCDSEYRSSTVWSGSSSVAAAEEVSVCGDCWVSESLARWRRSRNSSGGAGRKNNRADLGVGRARVSDDERKYDSDSVAVCDYSSTEEVRCLRLDAVEEEEEEEEAEENVDDDDGQWLVVVFFVFVENLTVVAFVGCAFLAGSSNFCHRRRSAGNLAGGQLEISPEVGRKLSRKPRRRSAGNLAGGPLEISPEVRRRLFRNESGC
ncbi:hypothetical protein ACLB2K_038105 [Fragaria x ananassa]